MKRYESRYCTFAVPDDWEAEPPFAFRERGEGQDRLTVQVLERSLAEMPSASAYAREQKPILAELYEGFDLLQEGPHRPEGSGEGYFLSFRFLNEDGYPSQGKTIYLTCGPLVFQLVLTGLDGSNRERDRLFEAIGKTFSFRQVDFLDGAKSTPLTSEILRAPQTEAKKGWPGTWRKFPRVCVSLPTPSGWEVSEEERDVLFRRGNAEIRLHRELGETSEAGAWFEDRLNASKLPGIVCSPQNVANWKPVSTPLSSMKRKGIIRTWKTAAVTHSLDLFLERQQPLVCSLRSPESGFSDVRPLFESLLAAASLLDPAEWETPLTEPWIDFVLRGPWQPQGTGIYVNVENAPVLIYAEEMKAGISLSNFRVSLLESLRGELDSRAGSEEEGLGLWRDHEAFRYSFDGPTQDQAPSSVRVLCINSEGRLRHLLVRGSYPAAVEPLFLDLLSAVRLH